MNGKSSETLRARRWRAPPFTSFTASKDHPSPCPLSLTLLCPTTTIPGPRLFCLCLSPPPACPGLHRCECACDIGAALPCSQSSSLQHRQPRARRVTWPPSQPRLPPRRPPPAVRPASSSPNLLLVVVPAACQIRLRVQQPDGQGCDAVLRERGSERAAIPRVQCPHCISTVCAYKILYCTVQSLTVRHTMANARALLHITLPACVPPFPPASDRMRVMDPVRRHGPPRAWCEPGCCCCPRRGVFALSHSLALALHTARTPPRTRFLLLPIARHGNGRTSAACVAATATEPRAASRRTFRPTPRRIDAGRSGKGGMSTQRWQ